MIKNIHVSRLEPHPNNPRKGYGDLSELKDSIAAQGILQNLTVVPKEDEEGSYIVVIGHRRLAAAIEAGIEVVPCAVVDMDEKTQQSTMLLENMQRSDLTPYEQAQGFQMCLDLGVTVAELSEKTGFSKKTVKHRLKMLELDQGKVENIQGTIEEYIMLEEIEDIKKRNGLLQYLGSPQFKSQVTQEIEKQKRSQRAKEAKELLEGKGVQAIKNQDRDIHKSLEWFSISEKLISRLAEYEFEEDREYFFVAETYYIQLFTLKSYDEASSEVDAEDAQRLEELKKDVRNRKAQIDEILSAARMVRSDLVRSIVNGTVGITQKQVSDFMEGLMLKVFEEDYTFDVNPDGFTEYLDWALFDEVTKERYGRDYTETVFSDLGRKKLKKDPILMLIATVYVDLENDESKAYNTYNSTEVRYNRSHFIEDSVFLNRLISVFGYEPTEEETQILDGSHALYTKDDGDEILDD